MLLGLIREGKIPADNRVALSPTQCKWIKDHYPSIEILVQSSTSRCFSNREYSLAGIQVVDDVSNCDILLGIKEVPKYDLIANKIYLFFSHTKKLQPHNKELFKKIISNKITLIDYECLEHEDGARVIGFGFFAGIVGAHNGMMAYGKRTGLFDLKRVYKQKNFKDLIHTYFGLRLPNVKIAVTGSGRVAHGIIEIMNLMGIREVEPDEYLARRFSYPVFTQLKSANLYKHKETGNYNRLHFHNNPQEYESTFLAYTTQTDILLNGVYWEKNIPRLFEKEDVKNENFIIQTIADITDDYNGSIPTNIGDGDIEYPTYGIDKICLEKIQPYQSNGIDIMAVGNLPNELPRDASSYFGEQIIKFILDELLTDNSDLINKATIVKQGKINVGYEYMNDYAS